MSTEIFKCNGITIANIKNKSEIAFFGVGILAGSNYEEPNIAGVSHYAEHLQFKGTKTRNWRQINEEFAKLGVSQNAYTSNEDVFYHSNCPKENISKVIALMMDMFFNSTYPKEEMEKERNVIIEEKKMYDDDPKAAFGMEIGNKFFDWSIGHDTIGTFETINSINRKQIMAYLKDKISLDNMIFICSGDIDSKDLKKHIEDNLPSKHPYLRSVGTNDCSNGFWSDFIDKPDRIKLIVERENIEQANILMLKGNLPAFNPLYYHSNVLMEALGGGMYSLLFSRLREELGLCYAIGSYGNFMNYPDRRTLNVYGYAAVNNVNKFIDESEKILRNVAKKGISKKIFECAKTDYLSSVLRATETSAGLGMFLVKKLLVYKNGNVEDVLDKIRAVELDECNELAKTLLDGQYNWAVMIPKGSKI